MEVRVTANVQHLCPYRFEVDRGQMTLVFEVADGEDAPELHALAAKLASYAETITSHEGLTRLIRLVTGATRVISTWTTAGMEVTCDLHG